MLDDPTRGVVWESVIHTLPLSVALVMLSASVGNAAELGAAGLTAGTGSSASAAITWLSLRGSWRASRRQDGLSTRETRSGDGVATMEA